MRWILPCVSWTGNYFSGKSSSVFPLSLSNSHIPCSSSGHAVKSLIWVPWVCMLTEAGVCAFVYPFVSIQQSAPALAVKREFHGACWAKREPRTRSCPKHREKFLNFTDNCKWNLRNSEETVWGSCWGLASSTDTFQLLIFAFLVFCSQFKNRQGKKIVLLLRWILEAYPGVILDEDEKGGGIRGRLSQGRKSQFLKEGKYQKPDLKNAASEGQKCKCGLPGLE